MFFESAEKSLEMVQETLRCSGVMIVGKLIWVCDVVVHTVRRGCCGTMELVALRTARLHDFRGCF